MAERQVKWNWNIFNSKLFTVSSCYSFVMDLLNSTQLPSETLEVLSVVWKSVVLSKVALFCWRVFLDRLPTKDNLTIRNVVVDNCWCPLCESCEEYVLHIFYQCPFSKAIWKHVATWLGVEDVEDLVGVHHFWFYGRIVKSNINNNRFNFSIWMATLEGKKHVGV